MRIEFQKGKRHYEGILADEAHRSITSKTEFTGRYIRHVLGLHLNGKSIGQGSLQRWAGTSNKEYLQTESTSLYRGFRKKGHGIVLYIFLVEAARMLGAKRIYSSRSLNKYSRRMWAEKLAAIYDVKRIPGLCYRCHRPFKKGRKPTFYIELQGK